MLCSSFSRRTLSPFLITAVALLLPATAGAQSAPVPFNGLPVTLLGNATAGTLPPPFLDVNDITSSGDDGIRVDVGSTRSSIGPVRWMAPEALQGRRVRVLSEGADAVGALWWAMDAVDLGGPVAFSIDPGNLVVAGSSVRLTLTDKGNPVYVGEQDNTLSPLFTSSAPPTGVIEGLGEIDGDFALPTIDPLDVPILDDRNWEFESGTQITITGVGTFTADGVRISHRLRHRDRLVLHHMDVLFAEPTGMVGSRTVRDVALGAFGGTHRGRGDLTLQGTESAGEQRLTVGNIGSSGEDGVAADFNEDEFGQTFVLDPASLPPPQVGESLALVLEGSWDGGSVVTVAKSACVRNGASFDVTYDARSSGAPLEVAFYVDDLLIGAASDPTAPLQVSAGSWPTGGGITAENDWTHPTASWQWETPVLVSSGTEAPVTADEVRILLPSLASGGIDWEGDIIVAPSMATGTQLVLRGRRNAVHPPDPGAPWVAMRSLGQAYLIHRDIAARVGNIGRSGEDGVRIEFVGGGSLSTDWSSPWTGAGVAGQRLEAAVYGPLEGDPDQPIIVGRAYNESNGSEVQLGADLSPLGATTLHYRLFDNGLMVADIQAVNDRPALSLPVPPTGFSATLSGPSSPVVPVLRISLVPDTPVTQIGGPTKRATAADWIEVGIGDAAPSEVTELSALSVRAKDLDWVTVGNIDRVGPVTAAPQASRLVRARLHPNVPNPFNPRTTISFDLAVDGTASVRIYDLRGERVRVLHEGFLTAGPHRMVWNGRDDRDRPVASGTYFVQLQSDGAREVRKMVLVR